MYLFPPQTAFGKIVPKSRIYTHAAPSRRVRDLFVSQLSEIVWAHKLSPETLHLPATPGVPEIQIFDLTLKTDVLDDEVLQAIDRAIPYPLIHRLHSESGIAVSAAFKRPSEADSSQWVVGSRFTSSFIIRNSKFPPLPVALDLGHLYAALFAPLLPLPPRSGEELAAHIQRCETHQRLTRSIDQLTARIHREKQFNRRVALNQQLKPLLAERTALGLRQPAAAFPEPACWPGSQCAAEEKPEGVTFSTQPLPAAGCGDESGSRLHAVQVIEQAGPPALDCAQPAAAFPEPACWPGSQCAVEEKPEGSTFSTQPLPAAGCGDESGSRLHAVQVIEQAGPPALDCAQPAAAFPEPACWPGSQCAVEEKPGGSTFSTQPLPAAGCGDESGSRLHAVQVIEQAGPPALDCAQPAAAFPEPACWPGSQCAVEEKPEGSTFSTQPLPAAGCGDESGSRLHAVQVIEQAGPPALDCAQPAAAFPEPACWPGSQCAVEEKPGGSTFSTQPLPAAGCGDESGSRLHAVQVIEQAGPPALDCAQPAAAFPEPACWPGSQCAAEEKPEGSTFSTQPLPAAGSGDESGSRLPQSKS